MALSFLYLAFLRITQILCWQRSNKSDLAIEVVLLRHEVAVLRKWHALLCDPRIERSLRASGGLSESAWDPRRLWPALSLVEPGVLDAGLRLLHRRHRALAEALRPVFIELDTRKVYVAGVTTRPTGAWVVQQARKLPHELTQRARPVKFMIRDRDTKFTTGFDEVFASEGIRIIRRPVRAPRANAFAERLVGTVRRECLDRILIVGRRHLEAVVHEYIEHYNGHRPHRSLGQLPSQPKVVASAVLKDVNPSRLKRTERIGGVIHEYRLIA